MQHPKNPFTYGDLVSDEAFTDRETELTQLASDLRNGQNVALIAPRRYGKSSLVKAALRRVSAEGMLVVEVDLMTTPTKERFAAKLAKSIHDDVASSLMKAREALRFFSTLRVVPTVTVDLNSSVRFSFAASRGSSDIDATIERLLELPAELAAERSRQLVVFFDEFQEVTSLDPRLPALMRSIFQTQREVAHLYAGSKREMMHSLFSDKNEPFFRSAKIMEIGAIPSPLFADYIRSQFDRTNRGVSDEAVERLLAVTDGHPYATQELAFALWDLVPEGFTATVTDFEAALEAVLRSENARFALVWENATQPQRLLLQALAAEPGRPFSNGYRVAHELPPVSGVQRALGPLVENELVRKTPEGALRARGAVPRRVGARLRELIADDVVGGVLVRQAGRTGELLAEHGEEDRVAPRAVVAGLEPAAQHAFLCEPELARDRQAALVVRLDLDVDPVEAAELDAGAGEHRRRLRRDPLPDRVRRDPVADLERAFAAARVQPGAAELLRLVAVEDAVGEIRPEVEPTPETAQQLDLLGDRLRLEADPRHPRPQVLDARIDGLLEETARHAGRSSG